MALEGLGNTSLLGQVRVNMRLKVTLSLFQSIAYRLKTLDFQIEVLFFRFQALGHVKSGVIRTKSASISLGGRTGCLRTYACITEIARVWILDVFTVTPDREHLDVLIN